MPRPGVVTALAIVCFVVAVYLLTSGLLLLITSGVLPLRSSSALPTAAGFAFAMFGMVASCGGHLLAALALILQVPLNLFFAVCFVAAMIYAALGIGIMKLKNWARLLVIVLAAFEIAAAVVGYVVPRFIMLRVGILGMAIDVTVLIVLFRSATKQAFGLKRT